MRALRGLRREHAILGTEDAQRHPVQHLFRLRDLGGREPDAVRERAEEDVDALVADQLLHGGDADGILGAAVPRDHVDGVVDAADGEAAGLVDLLDGQEEAGLFGLAVERQPPAGDRLDGSRCVRPPAPRPPRRAPPQTRRRARPPGRGRGRRRLGRVGGFGRGGAQGKGGEGAAEQQQALPPGRS